MRFFGQEDFPHVNFSLIETVADPQSCSVQDCGERETDEEMDLRIKKFLLYLRDRPESKIVVIGHSATLARMFEHHLPWHARDGAFRLQNAEVRSVVLSFD